MAKITFWAGQGCMSSGIASLIDVFSIANRFHQFQNQDGSNTLFEFETATTHGKPIKTRGGLIIQADKAIDEVEHTDLILIPPIMPPQDSLPDKKGPFINWLVDHHHQGVRIGSSCTGSFVLAEAGLLDGRIATTNWQFANLFRKRYPRVRLKPERILTEDHGLLCAGAALAIYNLGLHIIGIFGSQDLASLCAKALLIDPNRNSQAAYFIFRSQTDHGDPEIIKAQKWMDEHFAENITIDEIAKHIVISPRHFQRRFKKATGGSPLVYLHQLRIEAAKNRLETTQDTINEITWGVGYEDSSTFRRLFKKYTGVSAREYRDKFSRFSFD